MFSSVWNQNGRPVIGVSSGKLNQIDGLAISSVGYDPHLPTLALYQLASSASTRLTLHLKPQVQVALPRLLPFLSSLHILSGSGGKVETRTCAIYHQSLYWSFILAKVLKIGNNLHQWQNNVRLWLECSWHFYWLPGSAISWTFSFSTCTSLHVTPLHVTLCLAPYILSELFLR